MERFKLFLADLSILSNYSLNADEIFVQLLEEFVREIAANSELARRTFEGVNIRKDIYEISITNKDISNIIDNIGYEEADKVGLLAKKFIGYLMYSSTIHNKYDGKYRS